MSEDPVPDLGLGPISDGQLGAFVVGLLSVNPTRAQFEALGVLVRSADAATRVALAAKSRAR